MFGSGVIITGGKRRSDVNAMYALDPSPRHVQLWLHVKASAAFSEGALRLIALGLGARLVRHSGHLLVTLSVIMYHCIFLLIDHNPQSFKVQGLKSLWL